MLLNALYGSLLSPAAPMPARRGGVLVRRGARERSACPDSSGSPPHLFKSPLVNTIRAFFCPINPERKNFSPQMMQIRTDRV